MKSNEHDATINLPSTARFVRRAATNEYHMSPNEVFFADGRWWIRYIFGSDAQRRLRLQELFGPRHEGESVTLEVTNTSEGFGFKR